MTRADVVRSWQRVWRRAGFWVYLKSEEELVRFTPVEGLAHLKPAARVAHTTPEDNQFEAMVWWIFGG